MTYATIIIMLALLQFLYFGVAVGRARGRHGVSAPATSGDETFERFFRAHVNTLEQLVVFIPALVAASWYSHAGVAAGFGVAYLLGRAYYFRCYVRAPESRAPGMVITMVANVVLLGMGLVGAVRAMVA